MEHLKECGAVGAVLLLPTSLANNDTTRELERLLDAADLPHMRQYMQ